MSLINTVDHAFAHAAQGIVTASRFVSSTILPILKKASASEAAVEAVTGLVDPSAVNIERSAFAVLGSVIKAIDDAGAATASDGLNLTLDAALVADVKAIMPAVKTAALVSGTPITAPAKS